MRSDINLGFLGFGVVGQGLYEVLQNSTHFKSPVKKIVVKNPEKKRTLDKGVFYYDAGDLLDDPKINLLVEMIDESDKALSVALEAMRSGKNVVTANKKMVAENLTELIAVQQETGYSVLYEAACCGGIPIIRTLEEYYDNESLVSVKGIFNGSTNFILTSILEEGLAFDEAVVKAQRLGFAETDPSLDIDGLDARFKLVLIAVHAFGCIIRPDDILAASIKNLKDVDVHFAEKNGYTIKQIATIRKVGKEKLEAHVLPTFVAKSEQLANVDYENNVVEVEAAFSDKQWFVGKGAGGRPTGSAMLSDISANSYSYRYAYKKMEANSHHIISNEGKTKIYLRSESISSSDFSIFEKIHEHGTLEGKPYLIGELTLSALKRFLENDSNFSTVITFSS